MPTITCSYLDGTTNELADVGHRGMTLRGVLTEARLQGAEFGYGILKVNDVVQTTEDLEKAVGETDKITFTELQRPDDVIDLDTV